MFYLYYLPKVFTLQEAKVVEGKLESNHGKSQKDDQDVV